MPLQEGQVLVLLSIHDVNIRISYEINGTAYPVHSNATQPLPSQTEQLEGSVVHPWTSDLAQST